MVARAGDALVVMAGGGVRAHNVAAIVQGTGVREVHARILPTHATAPADAETRAAWADQIAALIERAGSAPPASADRGPRPARG